MITAPTVRTSTDICVWRIFWPVSIADTMVVTRIARTFININLTISTHPPVGAIASIDSHRYARYAVCRVRTVAAVLTRITQTFVDVVLTEIPSPTSRACAIKGVNMHTGQGRVARCTVLAWVAFTLVGIEFAIPTCPSSRTSTDIYTERHVPYIIRGVGAIAVV